MLKYYCIFLLFIACNALAPVSFYECELTKACFKTTRSCSAEVCEFGISWRPVRQDNIPYVEFEMVSQLYSDNGYIMMGFSEDKTFGNDGFVACYAADQGGAKIAAGYVSRNQLIQVVDSKDLLVTSGDDLGAEYNAAFRRLSCRFRRRVTPTKAQFQLKDLASGKKYYLFGARGNQASSYSLDTPTAGSIVFSSDPVDLAQLTYTPVLGSSGIDSSLAKTHGIFMVIAWVFCTSVGLIVVRYYKKMWPYIGVANEAVWFQAHRSLQVTAVLLTTIAFILIFIQVGGYSQLDSLPFKAHPILGIIVFILAFLNPLITLCRCRPESKDRPWFNWFHFFFGSIAYCLSVPTMLIGLRLPAAGLQLSRLNYPSWILILFVIFQVAVEIILEIHGCLYYRRNKDKQHTYDMEMEEYQAALIANQAPHTKPLPPKESGRGFKYFMLALHIIVAAIVAIVLVIIIAVN